MKFWFFLKNMMSIGGSQELRFTDTEARRMQVLGRAKSRIIDRRAAKKSYDVALEHLSGFALRSHAKGKLGRCGISKCNGLVTHLLWSWDGREKVCVCDAHKAGNIQFKVSSGGYRNQIKGTRIIEDGETFEDFRQAMVDATIAAFERIESNSRYAYHELSDTCPWMKEVNFKGKAFTQALTDARNERKHRDRLDELAREMVDSDFEEVPPQSRSYRHLTLPMSSQLIIAKKSQPSLYSGD